jgi:hypothetical protein
LAFDIERSGATNQYDTIALGACVVDSNFTCLDTYFCNCYFPKETVFEPRCMEQFWSTKTEILNSFIYTGTKTKLEREKEMIEGFQAFRAKWEEYASVNKLNYYLTSDNNVYDGGFVNELIYKHMPNVLPIPYSAGKQEYETFFESHSMLKGFLLSKNNSNEFGDWGLSDLIYKNKLMNKCPIQQDHNPVNDAYVIAYETQGLLNSFNS